MSPERWQRVKQIVAEAHDCGSDTERSDYVTRACANDITLLHEVRSLLAQPAELLDAFAAQGGVLQSSPAPHPYAGHIIGAYRLVKELGHGGMGSVWLAERIDDRFEHQVAIKLLTHAKKSDELLARFQAERRILARLEHPAIARLFDGGETADGLPFFVMEYVAGAQTITDFARERNLSLRERIELFRSVCAAIQFAHQHLIVHRDLKPGNILITTSGEPKLVDFGIARFLGNPTVGASATESERLTLAYASPEQRQGKPVSTAVDIYSLGVVLHELVTGELPSHRFDEANGHHHQLRGELQSIVGRATAGDPDERYPTASAFAEDLRRFLVRRPVAAHSTDISYRARRFVSRHKVGAVLAAAYAIALLVVTTAALEQGYRARRRFAEVQGLSHSVLFEIHDAIRDVPGTTAARQLIVSRALQYLDRLARESRGETALELELAAAYLRVGDVQGKPYAANLGDSFGALASYQKAIDIAVPLAAAESGASSSARAVLSQAYESLGAVQSRLHKPEEAARSHGLSLANRTQLLKTDPAHAEQWERGIVANYLGLGSAIINANRLHPTAESQREAIENTRRALAVSESLVARNPGSASDIDLLIKACAGMGAGLTDLGAIEHDDAVYGKALSFHHRAIDLVEGQLKNDPASAWNQRALADQLIATAYLRALFGKDVDEGLAECRRANEIIRDQATADAANAEAQQDLSSTYFVEARLLQAKGDFGHAEESYRQCLSILQPLVAAHPENVETAFDLSRVREGLNVIASQAAAARRNN